MDRQEDGVLSIAAASALLRVREQTLRCWISSGAFGHASEDRTGVDLSALLDILYRQPGEARAFERRQLAPVYPHER
jgi:hypothetical protein